jgi:hypothetical protein
MCFKQKAATVKDTVAAAPAQPLGVAEEPQIGDSRRKESIKNYGSETPSYRRKDDDEVPATPQIQM